MQHVQPIIVSSTINSLLFLQKAEKLADELRLPFVNWHDLKSNELALTYTDEGLKFVQFRGESRPPLVLLFVDFVGGKSGYRLRNDCTTQQPLAKAVGIKAGFRPTLLDATGGLGNDGFVLASLGCTVTLCERSPIIAALLQDGMDRARNNPRTTPIVDARMTLVPEDAQSFLSHCSSSFATIYLDPMYPQERGKALNRQTMRILRLIAGNDDDSDSLLSAALAATANRVVVKRPRLAPPLVGIQPSFTLSLKSSRFDIYLKEKAK